MWWLYVFLHQTSRHLLLFRKSEWHNWNQYKWAESGGSGFSVTPLCSLCVCYGMRVGCLCEFAFPVTLRAVWFPAVFRTSHQTSYSLERNWPLPFQSANHLSPSLQHLRRNVHLKKNKNYELPVRITWTACLNFLVFPSFHETKSGGRRGGKYPFHVL